jgi:hypothetical protein
MNVEHGARVRVHFNLHRGDYSIVDPRTGRVVANVETVTLRDVTFRVGEKTRLRTVATRSRSVHAYAVGIVEHVEHVDVSTFARVTYNPYRRGAFYDVATGADVWRADVVTFAGAYCYVPRCG